MRLYTDILSICYTLGTYTGGVYICPDTQAPRWPTPHPFPHRGQPLLTCRGLWPERVHRSARKLLALPPRGQCFHWASVTPPSSTPFGRADAASVPGEEHPKNTLGGPECAFQQAGPRVLSLQWECACLSVCSAPWRTLC